MGSRGNRICGAGGMVSLVLAAPSFFGARPQQGQETQGRRIGSWVLWRVDSDAHLQ